MRWLSASTSPGLSRSARRGTPRPSLTGWRQAITARWPTWPPAPPNESDPLLFAPDARSMILVAATYAANNTGSSEEGMISHPECLAIEGCDPAITQGRIARYAWGPDYHDTIKPKLHALDAFIRARTGRKALGKVFVDTAPVLERDFAEQAGLGFIGRNCCLITPGLGSWTVLAGLMVPEELDEAGRSSKLGEARSICRRHSSSSASASRAVAAAPAAWTPARPGRLSHRTCWTPGAASPT